MTVTVDYAKSPVDVACSCPSARLIQSPLTSLMLSPVSLSLSFETFYHESFTLDVIMTDFSMEMFTILVIGIL